MGAWGYGLFESDHDLDIVADLGHEAGLDKLEENVEQRLKDGKLTEKEMELYVEKKLPPYYTLCGGGSAPEEIRKHLDSGILETLFAEKEREMLHPPEFAYPEPGYVFCLLGACAMTLECKIPARHKILMQKHFLGVGMMEAAERQLFKALNGPGGYQEGVPHHFELPEDVKAAHDAEMEDRKARARLTGGVMMLNVASPGGFFAGPPKNKTLRAEMEDGKSGAVGCGGCGAEKKVDGQPLLRCGKCKKRGYYSTDCQKEHWKLHKKVCVSVQAAKGKENSGPQTTYVTGRGA